VVSPDGNLTKRKSPGTGQPRRGRPILVTGVPRSGTTWLARQLAGARLTALPGREPMNPRSGQFALAGTVSSWVELRQPSPEQKRVLARCYRGHEVRTFSRYGKDQWLAPMPWSRTVVKDPFALLSVPAIAQVTSAIPVIVYRHPGAVLASYRRMGWTADTTEIRALQGLPCAAAVDDVTAMVEFWNFLHSRMLSWLDDVPDALLVSHAEVSLGGFPAVRTLMRACGLRPARRAREPARLEQGTLTGAPDGGQLHGFARRPAEVVDGWRERLAATEAAQIESHTKDIWASLEARRFALQ
jgi:sulfotransferase family protein